VKILKEILKDFPLEDFLEKHFTKMPFSIPNGADNYRNLLDWKVVEDVMNTNKSKLRIVQDGRVIKDYVTLAYPEAINHHRLGHTLLLRYAELSHPKLKALADDFSHSFNTPVDIQLYCTPENNNAFGWHYDIEEVFIIQTKGSKHYTIRPNTIHPNPVMAFIPKDMSFEKEKTNIELNVTLEPGDFLYIPSGWWHVARTKKESMHISVGLMPSSALDLLSFLPEHFSRDVFWRTRIPVHKTFKNEEEEIDFHIRAITKSLKDLNEKMTDRAFVKSYIKKIKERRNK
jgi:50S ribosomal protein L16 3-hydroxylase